MFSSKTIGGRTFAFLAAFLLLIAVATAFLLVRSYSVYDIAGREAYSGIGTELISMHGCVVFYRWNNYTSGSEPEQEFSFVANSASSSMAARLRKEFGTETAPSWFQRRGFVAVAGALFGAGSSVVIVMVPDWFLVVVLMIPAASWYWRHRARRLRALKGSCISCGYDLRASSGRCPECGMAIPARSTKGSPVPVNQN